MTESKSQAQPDSVEELIPTKQRFQESIAPCVMLSVNPIDPYAYLRYVFTAQPKAETVEAIEALLPGNTDTERLITN